LTRDGLDPEPAAAGPTQTSGGGGVGDRQHRRAFAEHEEACLARPLHRIGVKQCAARVARCWSTIHAALKWVSGCARAHRRGGCVVVGDWFAGSVGAGVGYWLTDSRRGRFPVHDGQPVLFAMQAAYVGGYPHLPQMDQFSSPSWVLVRETAVECRHGETLRFRIPHAVIQLARYAEKVSTVSGLPKLRWGEVLLDFVAAGGTLATVRFRIPGQVSQIKGAKHLVDVMNTLRHRSEG
jgi:hypothetical protein